MPPDRIRSRRIGSRRPGRVEILHPAGSPFRHTIGAQNQSTDVRTDTTRIRVGDIFLGVVPSRHGVSHAHFRVLEIRFNQTRARIRIKESENAKPLEVWIDPDDLKTAIITGLAWHVSKAPFEI